MFILQSVAAALALAAPLVSAAAVERRAVMSDFTTQSPVEFTYPPGRSGFSAATASQAVCGGVAPGTRVNYPLTGGDISLTSWTALTSINLMWDDEANPTKFHGFHTYTNTINKLGSGHYCTKGPDFAALGKSVGEDVTLMMWYQLDGTATRYYSCADVKLVASAGFAPSSTYVCGNHTSTIEVASESDSFKMGGTADSTTVGTTAVNPHTESTDTSTTSSSSSSSPGSRLSAAAGGGIGAGVALAVVFILAAIAYATGFMTLGKKKVELRDDVSTTSSERPMKEAVRA